MEYVLRGGSPCFLNPHSFTFFLSFRVPGAESTSLLTNISSSEEILKKLHFYQWRISIHDEIFLKESEISVED
jgi:hypothetical protein